MPAYNAEEYIAEALESIISQSFSGQMEILISDDCSTDKTPQIIAQFAEQYPDLIRVFFNETNLGCSANSDSLTRKAKGKYLAFCDADDIWIDQSKLEKQVRILNDNPKIGMCCMADSSLINNSRCITVSEIPGFFLSLSDLLNSQGDVINSSIVCDRSLFESMRQNNTWFLNHNCFFDSIWAYWFSLHSNVFCIKDPVTYYRVLNESDCRSCNPQKMFILGKRYFNNKLHFLLYNSVDPILLDDFINKEYDRLFTTAKWEGEKAIRGTKTFKLGKLLISPAQALRRVLIKDE